MTNKRIVVCCDGTWQDGVVDKYRYQYTNILKISRLLDHQDYRKNPAIHQIVFYQPGIGSAQNFYSEYVEGTTGASLAEKVQEAYAFIAHNYQPGDEIFLFGFSRGAYTARMVAGYIGQIGVLDRKDMDHFADIFIAYQKKGNTSDEQEKQANIEALKKYQKILEKGRTRADPDGDGFAVKCVGVFDTVGSVGLPEELTFNKKFKQLFSFPDKLLGPHVQYAFHAMALNETRADFNVAKFIQTDEGRAKGQVLKQVWFTGSHADIGGGWQSHDLSDITLAWMLSNIEPMLATDRKYMKHLLSPVAPWGKQMPHDPAVGIFKLAREIQRTVPTITDDKTHEYIHPSVQEQDVVSPKVTTNITANPSLLCSLHELEELVRKTWPYVPGKHEVTGKDGKEDIDSQNLMKKELNKMVEKAGSTEIMVDEGGRPRYHENWLGSIIHEIKSWKV
ncbi:hypothetical protein M422DRAFT_185034 [Sphaerobolus stellatus SS14]|uniref:T6SS Phospholipase effector Tle1-like catalytic domain-containing protein n=1 Tax=Sphaerobolus stellatus (strain SS14) TaxID=990650 RepID=A0A0C9UBN1_SPHS4|nr:hypothetical protein M422DRAFT_185034 [Sphaerobolus stellatus SS14]